MYILLCWGFFSVLLAFEWSPKSGQGAAVKSEVGLWWSGQLLLLKNTAEEPCRGHGTAPVNGESETPVAIVVYHLQDKESGDEEKPRRHKGSLHYGSAAPTAVLAEPFSADPASEGGLLPVE